MQKHTSFYGIIEHDEAQSYTVKIDDGIRCFKEHIDLPRRVGLIESLKTRVDICEDESIIPSKLMVRRMENRRSSSNTGEKYITYRDDGPGSRYIIVRHRDLATTEYTTTSFSFNGQNYASTLKQAISFRNRRNRFFNMIADEYNELIIDPVVDLFKEEVKSLSVQTQDFEQVNMDYWLKACQSRWQEIVEELRMYPDEWEMLNDQIRNPIRNHSNRTASRFFGV